MPNTKLHLIINYCKNNYIPVSHHVAVDLKKITGTWEMAGVGPKQKLTLNNRVGGKLNKVSRKMAAFSYISFLYFNPSFPKEEGKLFWKCF